MNPRLRDSLIALSWFSADQATKAWASSGALAEPVEIVDNALRFALSYNTGALFGLFGDVADPWRSIVLVALPIGAIILIGGLLYQAKPRDRLLRVALALILGGALGNLTDRLIHGHVIDFIDVYAGWPPARDVLVDLFGTNRWPTFNVADSGLTCGALMLVIEVLPDVRSRRAAKEPPGASASD